MESGGHLPVADWVAIGEPAGPYAGPQPDSAHPPSQCVPSSVETQLGRQHNADDFVFHCHQADLLCSCILAGSPPVICFNVASMLQQHRSQMSCSIQTPGILTVCTALLTALLCDLPLTHVPAKICQHGRFRQAHVNAASASCRALHCTTGCMKSVRQEHQVLQHEQ